MLRIPEPWRTLTTQFPDIGNLMGNSAQHGRPTPALEGGSDTCLRQTRTMKKLIPLVALLCIAVGHASPFSEAFPPLKNVDRAADKPDFAAYRAKMLQVIAGRDAQALKRYLSPDIHYSFGLEKPGVAGFYSVWKPAEGKSPLWSQLAQVLGNGGSFDKQGRFVAPSWYANWPAGRDEAEWAVVSDSSVNVYFEPDESSKRLPPIGNCWVR